MKITMHGNPLTLVGTPIKAGETAPEFYGINQQMQPVSLKEFAGKVVVISSFPSIPIASRLYRCTFSDIGPRTASLKYEHFLALQYP